MRAIIIPETETHVIRSQYVDQNYWAQVSRPPVSEENHDFHPVIYMTDGNMFFEAVRTMSLFMQTSGEVPPHYLVAINYPGPTEVSGLMLRNRDLMPPYAREVLWDHAMQMGENAPFDGILPFKPGSDATTASDFMNFIEHELITLIEEQYLADPGDRTFFGYSLGGSFGLHMLFEKPELFQRYIIGSPVTSFRGTDFALEEVKCGVNRLLEHELFMSVGEPEEMDPAYLDYNLVSGFKRLLGFLKSHTPDELSITDVVYPGETHATAWLAAFRDGLRAVFKKTMS